MNSALFTRSKKKKDTAIQFTSSLLLHFLKKNVEARLGYLKDTGRAGETLLPFALGIEPGASCMLNKSSTTELWPKF